MKTIFKRAAAWLMAVMMIVNCIPVYAQDSSTDYSGQQINLADLMTKEAETATLTLVINNESYTNDPGSGETHLVTASPKGGYDVTYKRWEDQYKVMGTGVVDLYTIPAGTSLSDKGYSFPDLSVVNIGENNTYTFSPSVTWVTRDGVPFRENTIIENDTTIYLRLYGSAAEKRDLYFVCDASEGHIIHAAYDSVLLGDGIAQEHIDAATAAANVFLSGDCDHGPITGEQILKWQLRVTETGEMVDLVAGMPITDDYVGWDGKVKVYAVWETVEEPVTATFQYIAEDGAEPTIIETRERALGSILGTLPDMTAYTPEGKAFVGWQYEENGAAKYATMKTVITADTVYTAVFTDLVTATFRYVGLGTLSTVDLAEDIEIRTLRYGEALGTLPDMSAYETLYDAFAGWRYTDEDGNPQYATPDLAITRNMIFTADFYKVECGEVIFRDILPDGSENGEPQRVRMPVGMTIAEVFDHAEINLPYGTHPSDCIWRTPDGAAADMSAAVNAENAIELQTRAYQVVLSLKPIQSAFVAASGTRALIDIETDNYGNITLTITAHEGEKLTAEDFVSAEGVDLLRYVWMDSNGNPIDLQSLIDNGLTGNITATSNGTLTAAAAVEPRIRFRIAGDDDDAIYTVNVPAGTDLADWLAANSETKTSHIIKGNNVKLGAFVWKDEDGNAITDGYVVNEDMVLVGTLSDVTVTFYSDSSKAQQIGDVLTLSYGNTVSAFPTDELTVPDGQNFVEWRYTGTTGEVRFDSNTPVFEDMKVYAFCSQTHTVTFYTDSTLTTQIGDPVLTPDGEGFNTSRYPEVTPPAGQSLRYWVDATTPGSPVIFNPTIPITSDKKLYPVFDKHVIVIKDKATGEKITSVYIGSVLNVNVEAEEGYYYAGLQLENGTILQTNGEEVASTELFGITGEPDNGQYTVYVTPQFKKQVTVVYHAGEGAMILAAADGKTHTQVVNDSARMPGALDIIRNDGTTGIVFDGWAASENADDAQLTASQTYTNAQIAALDTDRDGVVHLYPVWDKADDAITVRFHSKYPTGAIDANGQPLENTTYEVYLKSGSYPVMPTLPRAGMETPSNVYGENNAQRYTISGWSTDQTGRGSNDYTQSKIDGVYPIGSQYQVAVTTNTDFYAIWIDDAADQNVTANFYIRSDGNIPQEPGRFDAGYYPAGWGNRITGIIKKPINIVNDPAKVALNIESAPSVSKIVSMLKDAKLNTDDGWSTTVSGSNKTVYYHGVPITVDSYNQGLWRVEWYVCKETGYGSSFNVDGRIRLSNRHMVTYMPNGGTNQYMPTSKQYEKDKVVTVEYTLGGNYPVRNGYTFLGWDEDPNATTPTYKRDDGATFTMPNNDVILYAIWACKPIELSFGGKKYIDDNGAVSASKQAFSFIIEKQDENGDYVQLSTVNNNTQGNFSFKYQFEKEGLYTFRVTEVKGTDATIAYDASVYTITVYIGSNEQGLYEVGRTVMKNNVIQTEQSIDFTNRKGKRDVTVTKVWKDENDQDGIRPSEITVDLLQDGKPNAQFEIKTLTAANGWSATWKDLPIATGTKQHQYTVLESSAGIGYTSTTSGDMDSGFTITNKHVPATTEVTVTKRWVDNSNAANIRPEDVTLTLTGSNGTKQTATFTGSGDVWTYTFTGLPAYHNGGTRVTYTVDETNVPAGYTKSVSGYTVTNEMLAFTVKKQVVGNMADPTKEFDFKVEILAADGTPVLPTETFKLGHGGVKTISGIPYGAYVQVTEDPAGYKAQHVLGTVIVDSATYKTEQPITSNGWGVTFINTNEVQIDTGVDLDGLPYTLLLLGAAGLGVLWMLLIARRRRDEA